MGNLRSHDVTSRVIVPEPQLEADRGLANGGDPCRGSRLVMNAGRTGGGLNEQRLRHIESSLVGHSERDR